MKYVLNDTDNSIYRHLAEIDPEGKLSEAQRISLVEDAASSLSIQNYTIMTLDEYKLTSHYLNVIDGIATEQKQIVRDKALNDLEYDFGDGRIIQTRPKDEQNIEGAIKLMEEHSIPTRSWVMKDNVKHDITLQELKDALSAGRLAAASVWDNYDPSGS